MTTSWGEAAMRERVRERENWVREGKKVGEVKKKGGGSLKCFSIKLLVMTCMSSL